MKETKETTLAGYEARKARLRAGETIKFRESGNSMTPKVRHREECTYVPVTSPDEIKKGDVVWCKVSGNHYTHLVLAKRGSGDDTQFQIGNIKGRVNGWIGISNIFAKVTEVEGTPI